MYVCFVPPGVCPSLPFQVDGGKDEEEDADADSGAEGEEKEDEEVIIVSCAVCCHVDAVGDGQLNRMIP